MRTEAVYEVLSDLARSEGPLQYGILGGNAGDALIDLGFFDLARKTDLKYEVVNLDRADPGRPLILSGGGGLVEEWGAAGSRTIVERLKGRPGPLVILPQTVRGNIDLLSSLGENVTLFTRENQSFKHVREHATGGATVLLDHDMAFNLDARRFLQQGRASLPAVRSAKDAVRLALYATARMRSRTFSTIVVRRKDVESATGSRSLRVYNDLSFVTAFRGYDEATVRNTGKLLLEVIDGYQKVTTDRLHVGIGAFLLGKSVTFVNNSNSKIKGIYEFSMASSEKVAFQAHP
ncbi:polysaccharide pyruvyl transferase family protein [Microbacterium sp. NPDC089318]